jgi:hypothetical protein
MASAQKLLMTMTGEIHQPVRLYYELYDQATVLQAFKTLRYCNLSYIAKIRGNFPYDENPSSAARLGQ